MNRGGNDRRTTKELVSLFEAFQAEGGWLDENTLKELLDYGEPLIPKLEQIIEAAIAKSRTMDEKAPAQDSNWIASVQALYLLAHLNARDSFDLVLDFLAQKQEKLHHWLPDIVSDDVWEVLYLLGQEQVEKLHQFVLDTKANEFSRLSACTALIQIALNNPSKKERIAQIFSELLAKKQDPDFVGMVIAELMDLKETSLQPVILDALQRHRVWSGIISAEEVKTCYRNKRVRKLTPLDIFERIRHFKQISHYTSSPSRLPRQRNRLHDLEKLL